jgi:hypothetical protein
VPVVKLSLCEVAGRGSYFLSFSESQGATEVGLVGVARVPSSLERTLSLLSFSWNGGLALVGVAGAIVGMVVATTGEGLPRPRTASFGTRFCALSIASKSGLGDKSWRAVGISKKRFL